MSVIHIFCILVSRIKTGVVTRVIIYIILFEQDAMKVLKNIPSPLNDSLKTFILSSVLLWNWYKNDRVWKLQERWVGDKNEKVSRFINFYFLLHSSSLLILCEVHRAFNSVKCWTRPWIRKFGWKKNFEDLFVKSFWGSSCIAKWGTNRYIPKTNLSLTIIKTHDVTNEVIFYSINSKPLSTL